MNDSNTNSSGDNPVKRKRQTRSFLVIVLGCLILAIITVPVAMYLFYGSTVRGEEFCPDDFSSRSFSYRRNIFSGEQSSGIHHTSSFAQVSDFLTTGGYLQPATKPKTWHLLWDNQSYELSEHTEAKILHDYLNQHDGSYTLRWQAWSEENDDHAKIFWPVIAQMAKDELYVEIPSVMESVRSPGNIDTFETQLIERVSDIYVARAVDARELGDKVQADALNNQAAQFRFDEDEVNRSKSGETDEPASKEPVLLEKPEVLEQPES